MCMVPAMPKTPETLVLEKMLQSLQRIEARLMLIETRLRSIEECQDQEFIDDLRTEIIDAAHEAVEPGPDILRAITDASKRGRD